jgi:hypothetical protein
MGTHASARRSNESCCSLTISVLLQSELTRFFTRFLKNGDARDSFVDQTLCNVSCLLLVPVETKREHFCSYSAL